MLSGLGCRKHRACMNPDHWPKTYELVKDGRAIACRICGLTSHHPGDVENLYCGNCHVYHENDRQTHRLQETLATLAAIDAARPWWQKLWRKARLWPQRWV